MSEHALKRYPAYEWYAKKLSDIQGLKPFDKNNKDEYLIMPYELVCRYPIGGKNLCLKRFTERGALATHVKHHQTKIVDGKKVGAVKVCPAKEIYGQGRSSTEKVTDCKNWYSEVKACHDRIVGDAAQKDMDAESDEDNKEFEPFEIPVFSSTTASAGKPHFKQMNKLLLDRKSYINQHYHDFAVPCLRCRGEYGRTKAQGCIFLEDCHNKEMFRKEDWDELDTDKRGPPKKKRKVSKK